MKCLYCSVYPLPWPVFVSPIIPPLVHQLVYVSIWQAAPSLQRVLSTNPEVTVWCICGYSWRDGVCCVCGCYRGGIVVMDVIWRRLCASMIWGKEICSELGKGATTEAGSLSSELLMCGGDVRSILLLPLVARCLETINVCIWRMFVFMSVVVTVWGSMGMFVV